MGKEHEVHIVLNKGQEAVVKSTLKASDRQALQQRLDQIRTQWEQLRKDAVDR